MKNKQMKNRLAIMLITLLVVVLGTSSVFAGTAPKLPSNCDKYYTMMYNQVKSMYPNNIDYIDQWQLTSGTTHTNDWRSATDMISYIKDLSTGVYFESLYNSTYGYRERDFVNDDITVTSNKSERQDIYNVNGQNIILKYDSSLPGHSLYKNRDDFQALMITNQQYLNGNLFLADSNAEKMGLFGMISEYNARVDQYNAYLKMLNILKTNCPTTYKYAMNYVYSDMNSHFRIVENRVAGLGDDISYYVYQYAAKENPTLYNWLIQNNYITVINSINAKNMMLQSSGTVGALETSQITA